MNCRLLSTVHVNTERGFGGGESQTLLLARGLSARGHRALVVAPPGSALLERARAAGLPVRAIEAGSDVSLSAARALAGILREVSCEVLHLHTPRAVGFGVRAALRAGTPAVVASRRAFPHRPPGLLDRWKWRRPDRIVAVSEALRVYLAAHGIPSSKLVVIRSGIDLERAGSAPPLDPRGEFGWPPEALVVASVGNLHAVKGHLRLVRAAAHVVREEPRARFLVAGEGPERERLEREIAAAALEGRFVLAGFREDALSLLLRSDLFVLPSRAEGFPNALVEALALGLPSIATDAGGCVEVVGRGRDAAALLVPAALDEDGAALAGEIVRVLRDEALRGLLAAAGPARAALLSAQRMAEATEALYRELLARTGS